MYCTVAKTFNKTDSAFPLQYLSTVPVLQKLTTVLRYTYLQANYDIVE